MLGTVRGCAVQCRPGWARLATLAVGLLASVVNATPEFVTHNPATHAYGEAADVTMREPGAPREGESVAIWSRVGYSFYWDSAAIYYTTDGTEPTGSRGVAGNGQVASMGWVRNEPASPSNIDWLVGTIPAQNYGTTVRYKVGVWASGGGIEVFANNTGCSDDVCDDNPQTVAVFDYDVLLAWPGRGYPNANAGDGFPDIHFWKEEGVVGNNYMNVMVDANGTVYDIYFPSAGCVQGVGTKNEGYTDGDDTFPGGLPAGYRGQMHINQAQAGIRVGGTTYWLSNSAGDAFIDHSQAYVTDNNVVASSSRFVKEGQDITVDQYDFCPAGITYPNDGGSQPVRGLYVKRYLLTNNGGSSATLDFYFNTNFAINGGDDYDAMFADKPSGAMVGYDNTFRTVTAQGAGPFPPGNEYNPTSFGSYDKDTSIYLGVAMKLCDSVGSATGTPATDSWGDSSDDDDAGWIGTRVTMNPGETKEVDVIFAGGFDAFAGATGTYDYHVAPALDWFHSTSMADVQTATEVYWTDWLASGVDVDFPDDDYDRLYRRGLLATALHVDAEGGGVIAGMHNGAYPFVWPRDALYAAVTLDRTGHEQEVAEIFRFLDEVAYRDEEEPGRKGFWYQKYTTDGYIIWSAPQVDETSNVTWAAWHHYLSTGDINFLDDYYHMFYEAGRAMSEDSNISSNLRYEESVDLMYSNNVWEDSFDTFIYSNATVIRGLEDAVRIADELDQNVCPGGPGTCNYHNDAALFASRANAIRGGLDARLTWDGENTDISQLGIVWPFETHSPTDPLAVHVIDRINGVATDTWGNNHPLMNFGGEWDALVNRYWNDTYWWNISGPNANGSPWFLTTLWYGQYYAKRQDYNPGKADIDNHKHRIDRTRTFLGPMGLGAEQMSPNVSLLYPGQTDFKLQAAWPNAWESMSFLTDCVMLFLDHVPDAPNQMLKMAPKLPTGWETMTYKNIHVGAIRVNVTCSENDVFNTHALTNVTGGTLNYDTYVRIPAGKSVESVLQDGVPVAHAVDGAASRVHVTGAMNPAADSTTVVKVVFESAQPDYDADGDVDSDDFTLWENCGSGPNVVVAPECEDADYDSDGDADQSDFGTFQLCYSGQDVPVPVECR